MTGISGQLDQYQGLSDVLSQLQAYCGTGKHSAVVQKRISWLAERCIQYRGRFQFASLTLGQDGKITEDDAAALFLLYDSNRFKGHDDARAAASLAACPYCGISHALTLDHYLPRNTKHFPHFSFAAFNLVPACGSCQGLKGTFHPSIHPRHALYSKKNGGTKHHAHRLIRRRIGARFRISNTQRLIHPYFDSCIHPEKISIRFNVDPVSGPDDPKLVYGDRRMTPAAALFSHHVKRLELERRILPVIRRQWDGLERTLRRNGVLADHASVSAAVLGLSHHHESYDGVGSIATIFYKAVSQSAPSVSILVAKLRRPPPSLVRRR